MSVKERRRTMGKAKILVTVYILLLCTFGIIPVYGVDIVIIPITYYERQGTSYVQRSYERDITADIVAWLNKFHEVTIDRAPLRDRLAGATDADARRAAEYYNVHNVVYGLVRRDGNSLSAEIKIYNIHSDENEVMYASDTVAQYDRLIKTIGERILEWYETDKDKIDTLQREIRDLRSELASVKEELTTNQQEKSEDKKERPDVEKEFGLRLPVSVGYWSYVDRLWVELVQGTVEMRVGVDVFPELQFRPVFGMKNELSFGMQLGYRNGVTGNRDALVMHGIIINPMMGYHLNFYPNNWICLGVGLFYELDLWEIEEPEYNKTQSHQQSLTGYSIALDYSYQLNQLVAVNLGMNFSGYFVSDTSFVMRFYLGAVITLIGGKR
jgi:TolB-like protein